MTRSGAIRFLRHGPVAGARNMAVDEALMGAGGSGETVLRVYGWSPPCLSLGRNQRARGRYDTDEARSLGVEIVRRPTGGRAVYHHRELTYAVAAPSRRWGSLPESYRLLNRALIRALASLGVEAAAATGQGTGSRAPGPSLRACFRDPLPGEIVADGRKLVGSAQWRRGGALLQHGSILLEAQQEMAERLRVDGGDGRAAGDGDGPAADRLPGVGLSELLDGAPDTEAVAAALADGFREELGVAVRPSSLSPSEERAAADLEARYRDPEWTWRR